MCHITSSAQTARGGRPGPPHPRLWPPRSPRSCRLAAGTAARRPAQGEPCTCTRRHMVGFFLACTGIYGCLPCKAYMAGSVVQGGGAVGCACTVRASGRCCGGCCCLPLLPLPSAAAAAAGATFCCSCRPGAFSMAVGPTAGRPFPPGACGGMCRACAASMPPALHL